MENSFLSHSDAALRNRNSILRFVKQYGPISRTDIWEGMNISRASVTQVIRQLQESNLIVEIGEGESTGGRKPRYITFNSAAKKLFAFDGITRTLYLSDLGGTVLYETQLCFDSDVSPEAFQKTVSQEIDSICSRNLCPESDIIGFALSLPGLINSRNCTVIYSVELGWQNVDLMQMFSHRFGQNIFLERTGNTMALGAFHHGSMKGASHFQLFILGLEGIGVSTVFHGSSQHGANYMHGELGHIKLPCNVLCSCGQQGCLEAVVNQHFQEKGQRITNEILEYLSIGIAAAVNISDPDSIMLVGSFVDMMTASQKAQLSNNLLTKVTGSHSRKLGILFSRDTKHMALMGICAYTFDRYFSID